MSEQTINADGLITNGKEASGNEPTTRPTVEESKALTVKTTNKSTKKAAVDSTSASDSTAVRTTDASVKSDPTHPEVSVKTEETKSTQQSQHSLPRPLNAAAISVPPTSCPQPIDIVNHLNPTYFYPTASTVGIGRKHYETVSVDDLMTNLLLRQEQRSMSLATRSTEDRGARQAVVEQALRTLQVREAAVESTEMSSQKLLLFDEKIQRKEKEVEQREMQVTAKDIENQKTERELKAREREQQIQYDKKIEPLAAREFQIARKEDDLKTIESALESRVKSHTNRINQEEEAIRSRERTLRENEIRLQERVEQASRAQQEYQNLHQQWLRKVKHLAVEEEQINSREKELTARELQLFSGEKSLLASKQKLSTQETDLIAQKAELHAAHTKLDSDRSRLQQQELKHDAAVTKLVDARAEVTHQELALERKKEYSDKLFLEASELFLQADTALQLAEQERAAAADLMASAEAKMGSVLAKERVLKRYQQGLENQKIALEASRTDLICREHKFADILEEFDFNDATQFGNDIGEGPRLLEIQAQKSLLFSDNTTGFVRLGTAGTLTVPQSAKAGQNSEHLYATQPLSIQKRNQEVADLYSKPLSRKIVSSYAQRPLPRGANKQLNASAPAGLPLAFGAKSKTVNPNSKLLLLPPISNRKDIIEDYRSPSPNKSGQNTTIYDRPFGLTSADHSLADPRLRVSAAGTPVTFAENERVNSSSRRLARDAIEASKKDKKEKARSPVKHTKRPQSPETPASSRASSSASESGSPNQKKQPIEDKKKPRAELSEDEQIVDFIRIVSQFWAEEKECNEYEKQLEGHLAAMKSGSSALPPTFGNNAAGDPEDDISWSVEHKMRSSSNSNKPLVPKFSHANSTMNSPAPSIYRMVAAEDVYECVYVKGAQQDAKSEFQYLVNSVLVAAASATRGSQELNTPQTKEADATLVYHVASALCKATNADQSQAHHEGRAATPLSAIVLSSFKRAQWLLSQRSRWLAGCLDKINVAVQRAAEEDIGKRKSLTDKSQPVPPAKPLLVRDKVIEDKKDEPHTAMAPTNPEPQPTSSRSSSATSKSYTRSRSSSRSSSASSARQQENL